MISRYFLTRYFHLNLFGLLSEMFGLGLGEMFVLGEMLSYPQLPSSVKIIHVIGTSPLHQQVAAFGWKTIACLVSRAEYAM